MSLFGPLGRKSRHVIAHTSPPLGSHKRSRGPLPTRPAKRAARRPRSRELWPRRRPGGRFPVVFRAPVSRRGGRRTTCTSPSSLGVPRGTGVTLGGLTAEAKGRTDSLRRPRFFWRTPWSGRRRDRHAPTFPGTAPDRPSPFRGCSRQPRPYPVGPAIRGVERLCKRLGRSRCSER